MSDFTNNPQGDQDKFLNMMPNYGMAPIEEFRVGFGRRFGAFVLDLVIMMIVTLVAMQIFGILDAIQLVDWQAALSNPEEMNIISLEFSKMTAPLGLAIGIVYYSMELFFAGTPGKLILGIVIAKANRTHADFKDLFTRFAIKNSAYIFTALYVATWNDIFSNMALFINILIIIAFFFVLSQTKQALYDRFSGTAVYFKDELLTGKEEVPNL